MSPTAVDVSGWILGGRLRLPGGTVVLSRSSVWLAVKAHGQSSRQVRSSSCSQAPSFPTEPQPSLDQPPLAAPVVP